MEKDEIAIMNRFRDDGPPMKKFRNDHPDFHGVSVLLNMFSNFWCYVYLFENA